MNDKIEEKIEEKTDIIVKDKNDALKLRWLQHATKKNGEESTRPTTAGIYKKEKECVSSDWFRLHIISDAPDCIKQLENDKSYMINNGKNILKGTGRVYETKKINGEYFDYSQLIPETFVYHISVDRSFLLDAIQDLPLGESDTERITLKFGEPTHPIVVSNEHGTAKAVIMPMHRPENVSSCTWEDDQRVLKYIEREYPNTYKEAKEKLEEKKREEKEVEVVK